MAEPSLARPLARLDACLPACLDACLPSTPPLDPPPTPPPTHPLPLHTAPQVREVYERITSESVVPASAN